MNALLVFVGGGSGALLRWGMGRLVTWPWGTVAVNLIGCFAIGVLAGWLTRTGAPEGWWLLFGVGLLGGFTTMSAFALDTVSLWHDPLRALLYAAVTVAGSLGAVAAGVWLTR